MTTVRLARHRFKLIAVATGCVAIGAGISAIASAGATSSASQAKAGQRGAAHGEVRVRLRRAVHGDLVVPTKTGFATITLDRGIVQGVTGRELMLREGTKRATYRTVTLTIPGTARIRDNRHPAALADLKAGQRVIVLHGPKRTVVVARDVRTP